jgi:nitrogen fixation-related uncharacterized protein
MQNAKFALMIMVGIAAMMAFSAIMAFCALG